MPAHTLPANYVSLATFEALDSAAQTLPEGDARDALDSVTEDLREGHDVVIFRADAVLSPSQAADILGVSRTHLYKVLDDGSLPFHIVGTRDRRIRATDLKQYVVDTEEARQAAAERLANARTNRAAAIDEMS